jgi:hypothetical protein
MPILLFPEGCISAFWDHNHELTIGFQELGPAAQGVKWGLEQGLCKVRSPSPTPRMSDPVCPGLILCPITSPLSLRMHACTRLFFLSSLLGGVAAGHSHV